jgi:hypothetical protein
VAGAVTDCRGQQRVADHVPLQLGAHEDVNAARLLCTRIRRPVVPAVTTIGRRAECPGFDQWRLVTTWQWGIEAGCPMVAASMSEMSRAAGGGDERWGDRCPPLPAHRLMRCWGWPSPSSLLLHVALP